MRGRLLVILSLRVATAGAGPVLTAAAGAQSIKPVVQERRLTSPPIHYFVSRPADWNGSKHWPVVVVITDAYRQFETTAQAFAAARGSRPFIIVVPLVLSGGGAAAQHMTDFDYGRAEWASADSIGGCRFDDDGLAAIMRDVHERDNGEDRVFMTGWEAGGHVVLAQVLEHPERVRAAVVVTPNFQGRCVASSRRVDGPQSSILVRIFHGADDPAWTPSHPLYGQSFRFDTAARVRGFTNVRDSTILHRSHGSLVDEVLTYFAGRLAR